MITIGLNETMGFQKDDIVDFMKSVDDDFIPPIASRVDLGDYADRLLRKAAVFVACRDGVILGLAACYCNDHESKVADLSYLAVHKNTRGLSVGKKIMIDCLAHARKERMCVMRTKTAEQNTRVINFYLNLGFSITGTGGKRLDGSSSVFFEIDLL